MVQRRCMSRKHPSSQPRWHDKGQPCPHCGDQTSPLNKHLYTEMLNRHLYGSVDRQRQEVDFVKRARREREPA